MCSLSEAFQTFGDPASRNDNLLGEFAEEPPLEPNGFENSDKKRKKKRRAPMPPSEQVIEPDRPAHRKAPPAELLGIQSNTETTSTSEMLNALESSDFFPHPSTDSANKNAYMLEPNWATAFNDSSAPTWIKTRMPPKTAEAPLIPSPWMDGAPTLWKKVPEVQAKQVELDFAEKKMDTALDSLQRKFDIMFKKLEDLESARSESQHLEIILFVLGGVFILLLLDLLVRQGSQAMVMLGNANTLVGGTRMFPSM